jgi:oligopeptide transport system ATP-binding protein
MRQRAMIAIVLAAEPKLLLADEPTTALDVTIQDQILKLLKRLVRDLGMAMILVTHDLGVVAETCDRVLVMYAGQVVESAPVERLFAQPRHAYSLALLRSVPQGLMARAPLQTIPGQPPRLDRPVEGCAFLPRCHYHEPACSRGRPPLVEVGLAHSSACLAAAKLPPWTPAA